MVKVYTTNVHSVPFAAVILADLKYRYPEHRITIDMEDVDRVLRVEGPPIEGDRVIDHLNQQGFQCFEM
jgi:hypothetical protein